MLTPYSIWRPFVDCMQNFFWHTKISCLTFLSASLFFCFLFLFIFCLLLFFLFLIFFFPPGEGVGCFNTAGGCVSVAMCCTCATCIHCSSSRERRLIPIIIIIKQIRGYMKSTVKSTIIIKQCLRHDRLVMLIIVSPADLLKDSVSVLLPGFHKRGPFDPPPQKKKMQWLVQLWAPHQSPTNFNPKWRNIATVNKSPWRTVTGVRKYTFFWRSSRKKETHKFTPIGQNTR